MSQVFASQLDLKIWITIVGVQKIDSTILQTYEMVVFTFSILDKDNKEKFLKKSFLLADNNPDVVLKMLFLTMSNVDIHFQVQDFE